MLTQQHVTVANIFLYLILTIILLIFGDGDTWRLRRRTESDKQSAGCCCS
jgi:hypothetical protein